MHNLMGYQICLQMKSNSMGTHSTQSHHGISFPNQIQIYGNIRLEGEHVMSELQVVFNQLIMFISSLQGTRFLHNIAGYQIRICLEMKYLLNLNWSFPVQRVISIENILMPILEMSQILFNYFWRICTLNIFWLLTILRK